MCVHACVRVCVCIGVSGLCVCVINMISENYNIVRPIMLLRRVVRTMRSVNGSGAQPVVWRRSVDYWLKERWATLL